MLDYAKLNDTSPLAQQELRRFSDEQLKRFDDLAKVRAEMLRLALSMIEHFEYRDQSFLRSYAHTVKGLAGRTPDTAQLAYLSDRQASYLAALASKARSFAQKEAQDSIAPVESRFTMLRPRA